MRHTQQVVLEACLQASSARLLEENHPALNNAQQRKAELSCIPEPAGASANFSLEMLDLAVSDSLETHTRRINEIDTNEAKSTSWIIYQRQTQSSSCLQPTATAECPANFRNVTAEGELSRVLHVLTREEFREALQYSRSDKPSAAISTITEYLLNVKANKHPVLVVDGICNAASNRLHQAQLRLHIYRQSKRRE